MNLEWIHPIVCFSLVFLLRPSLNSEPDPPFLSSNLYFLSFSWPLCQYAIECFNCTLIKSFLKKGFRESIMWQETVAQRQHAADGFSLWPSVQLYFKFIWQHGALSIKAKEKV